jgi:hypothetical protein
MAALTATQAVSVFDFNFHFFEKTGCTLPVIRQGRDSSLPETADQRYA